jgi:hypothetical protein
MNEQALHFGPAQRLFGLLTFPDSPDPRRPAVLIPNSGVEHRVGAGRMHVELARALAAAGVITLRLDLAGWGDSAIDPEQPDCDSARDLAAAMDALATHDLAHRFIGIGLASGAHHIHRIARVDERVVGGVFLDGYSYKTPRFWVNYGVDRLTQSKRYGGILERITQTADTAEESAATAADDRFAAPSPAQMKADLQTFIARGMALCYLFTGEMQADYNYREQLTDAFPFLRGYPQLSLRYLPDMEHSFSRRVQREEMIRLLVDWVLSGLQSPRVPLQESRH